MRITKVYTRTGDKGTTRLAGGQPVPKDHPRVEAYGTIDEVNSCIGVVLSFFEPRNRAESRLEKDLQWIQHKLFDLGGIVATVPGQTFHNMPTILRKDVVRLERVIDRCQKDLTPLSDFILPGGSQVPALLHVARTVCRRGERMCVTLSHEEKVDRAAIQFLNRLSDVLFVLARWVASSRGEMDVLWKRT